MSGKLIVLEGLDGSGKATQTRMLCESLVQKGISLRRISFPDYRRPSSALVKLYLGGAFGTDPNAVNAYAASSFFAVDRFASYRTDWQKDYARGTLIVADRYTTSNIVFQLAKLPREEWEGFLSWVQDYEYGKLELPRPDLTLYLDMPTAVSQHLLELRYRGNPGRRDIHERNLAFLAACRKSAEYAACRLGWTVVPCAEGNAPKAAKRVHAQIMKEIAEEFPFYASF